MEAPPNVQPGLGLREAMAQVQELRITRRFATIMKGFLARPWGAAKNFALKAIFSIGGSATFFTKLSQFGSTFFKRKSTDDVDGRGKNATTPILEKRGDDFKFSVDNVTLNDWFPPHRYDDPHLLFNNAVDQTSDMSIPDIASSETRTAHHRNSGPHVLQEFIQSNFLVDDAYVTSDEAAWGGAYLALFGANRLS